MVVSPENRCVDLSNSDLLAEMLQEAAAAGGNSAQRLDYTDVIRGPADGAADANPNEVRPRLLARVTRTAAREVLQFRRVR